MEAEIASFKSYLQANVPNIDPNLVSNIPGNWRLASRDVLIGHIMTGIDRANAMYGSSNQASTDAENALRKRRLVIRSLRSLNRRQQLQKSAFAELVDDRGNTIRVYSDPRSKGSGKGVGSDQDIQSAATAFQKIRDKVGSDKQPVIVSLVSPSSFLPSQRDASTESNTLGFAFPGAGAHILPSRLKAHWDKAGASEPYTEDSWHSVEYKTYEDKVIQTTVHEIGHVLMYKYWGNDSFDNGATALTRDYKAFGVFGQKVSRYGTKNVAEHFAEAYARYILTGDATPEFMDLLRSKGLLKSQQESQNG